MYTGAASTSGGSNNRGVQICAEPTPWRIKEISLDGDEEYIPFPTFSELMASNARLINWREIVGKDATFDFRVGDDPMDEEEKKLLCELSKLKPAAGPWSTVARSIHSSMQDMNFLLDTFGLLRTPYINVAPVSAVVDEQKTSEQISSSKVFQFNAHKKALSEAAAGVLTLGEKSRYGEGSEKTAFFQELRRMRENWRIRKVNHSAVGDLGYHVYGPKYRASELFDIIKQSSRDDIVDPAAVLCPIRVEVPLCLARRTTLTVSVQDDAESSVWSTLEERALPVDETACRSFHWEKVLKWAQNTMMLGDAFMQLRADTVDSNMFCASTDSAIALSLFDTTMLRIDLKHYPFQDADLPPAGGDAYLTRTLHELYIGETMRRRYANQQFVSLRQSTLPENLEMRGPLAISGEEIAARKMKAPTLLSRLIDATTHYLLVNRVIDTIGRHTLDHVDPLVQFKFHRCTSTHTQLALNFTNRFYEQLGKYSFFVRITTDNVVVVTKEGQHIHCRREMNLLRDAFRLLTVNYQLHMITLLARHYFWQLLHSNNNAFNQDGIAAPTLYLCNQNASNQIFVQCPSDGSPPRIFIKLNADLTAPLSSMNGPTPADRFRRVNIARLPGTTLLRKLDCLLLMFRK